MRQPNINLMPVGVFRKSHISEETSGVFFEKMSNKKQFWVDNGRCRYFDFDALYQSLSDGPMTDDEKKMLEETWRKSTDFILAYFEDDRLTTKEGYRKLNDRYSSAYHREEYAAGLG